MEKIKRIILLLAFLILFGISNFCLSHIRVVLAETINQSSEDSCNQHEEAPQEQDSSFSCCVVHDTAKIESSARQDIKILAQPIMAGNNQLSDLSGISNDYSDFYSSNLYLSSESNFLFSVFKKE